MKTLKLFTILILFANSSFAVESSARSSMITPLLKIKTQIETLDTSITIIDSILQAAAACGDLGEHYNGTSCVTINELDPNIKIHGLKDMTTACTDIDKAQYYNTSTDVWACKTLSN
tara:strand:- start:850 stop:1200 length:351 start_codon:yes stop_codon:yes gene_type:complete